MDDIFRLNGNVMSAKSTAHTIEGVPYVGIVALDYEDALETEYVHGMNKNGSPLGYTEGQYSVSSLSMSVLKDVWIAKLQPQLLLLSLAAGAPGSYGGARFTYVCQYQEGVIVGADTLEGCRIVGTKDSVQQGTGKLVIECKMLALTLRRSGATLYNPVRIP